MPKLSLFLTLAQISPRQFTIETMQIGPPGYLAHIMHKPLHNRESWGARVMGQWLLMGFVSLATITPAHAGILGRMPEPENFALLALGLTGLTIGWFGARGRGED